MVRNVLVNVLENDIALPSALPIRYITPEMISDEIKTGIIVIMNII